MNDAGKEKKIIIDEDWKTQVEAEKVAAEADRSEVKEGQGTDAVAQESAPEAVAEPGWRVTCGERTRDDNVGALIAKSKNRSG